jgi:hypothetical protein
MSAHTSIDAEAEGLVPLNLGSAAAAICRITVAAMLKKCALSFQSD